MGKTQSERRKDYTMQSEEGLTDSDSDIQTHAEQSSREPQIWCDTVTSTVNQVFDSIQIQFTNYACTSNLSLISNQIKLSHGKQKLNCLGFCPDLHDRYLEPRLLLDSFHYSVITITHDKRFKTQTPN